MYMTKLDNYMLKVIFFFYSEKQSRRKLSLLGIKITNRRLLERWSFLTIFQDQDNIRIFSLISSPKSKTIKTFSVTPNFPKGQAKHFLDNYSNY